MSSITSGALMAAEIAEQPEALARLLDRSRPDIAEAARRIRQAEPRFVLFTARGTSDHAALYAKYLVEVGLGLPAGMASPSTVTAYDARPAMRDTLLVAVSQSGGSPDLLAMTERASECGALTLAVTNDADSPLSRAAELHVDVAAGPERAVAATKSYTSELLALWLVLDGVRGPRSGSLAPDVRRIPEWAAAMVATDPTVAELAVRFRFAQRVVTTGRGFSYPTALEAALKLMETSYLAAQAFSGADLLHGPLAMLDPTVPVLAVVGGGLGGDSMAPILARIRDSGADLTVVGSPAALAQATAGIALPRGIPEELSPIIEVIPLQLLALHLSVARGGDPDAPRGLRKVTETL